MLEKVINAVYHNPKCPKCGKNMKSIGKNKGFECKKCGFQNTNITKIRSVIERHLENGKVYLASIRSQRHLTKPLSRYNLEHGRTPFHETEMPYGSFSKII